MLRCLDEQRQYRRRHCTSLTVTEKLSTDYTSPSEPALGMFEVFGRTGPPTLGEPPFRTLKITYKFLHYDTHCNADKRTRNAATRRVLPAYNAAKCDCGRDSVPDPLGEYSSPDPLSGSKGAASRQAGEGEEGREREGRGGEFTLMRTQECTATSHSYRLCMASECTAK